jgi:hypothetical protein
MLTVLSAHRLLPFIAPQVLPAHRLPRLPVHRKLFVHVPQAASPSVAPSVHRSCPFIALPCQLPAHRVAVQAARSMCCCPGCLLRVARLHRVASLFHRKLLPVFTSRLLRSSRCSVFIVLAAHRVLPSSLIVPPVHRGCLLIRRSFIVLPCSLPVPPDR